MHISVLASGSSGNSTYIESKKTKILIDAGISKKKISKELDSLGTELKEINGIFITHEHVDHIKGLEKINKENVPIFMTIPTYLATKLTLKNVNFIKKEPFNFNGLYITPTKTSHDAADPVGYVVNEGHKTLSYFTDLGVYDKSIIDATSKSDAMVLESNHDIDMVLSGNYPYYLKQRILGETGHLSNIDASLLLAKHAKKNLKTVFLAHLSKNNNTENLAKKTFSQITNDRFNSIITKPNERTELIKI